MINEICNSEGKNMKISDRGQITIPNNFRKRFGLNKNVEIEFVPTDQGLLIQKMSRKRHPVETVIGILKKASDSDRYIEEVRGR
jgi:bifunctional DNA-binding transcriptional regulator/antitoxin component of YhaV-PrlF toxin-antitoxin module